MIMQKVNVLPSFVTQDADIKRNESPSSSGTGSREKDFSNLVEQHIKKKEAADKSSRRAESEHNNRNNAVRKKAANTDNYKNDSVAKNGKVATNDKQQNQVTSAEEKKAQASKDNVKNNIDEVNIVEQQENTQPSAHVDKQESDLSDTSTQISDQMNEDNHDVENDVTSENEAMLASQKFISLLYNSDKTLADSVIKNKASTDISESSDVDSVEGKKSSTNVFKSEAQTVNGDKISTQGNADNTVVLEHKLKAFADEVSANTATRPEEVTDVELLKNKETLNRYQQQLLLKGEQATSKSSASEIDSTDSQGKQKLVNAQDVAKLAPLSVEPIIESAEDQLNATEQDLNTDTVNRDEQKKLAALTKLKAKLENESISHAKEIQPSNATKISTSDNAAQQTITDELTQVSQLDLKQVVKQTDIQVTNQVPNQALKQGKEHQSTPVINVDEMVETIKSNTLSSGSSDESSQAQGQQQRSIQTAVNVSQQDKAKSVNLTQNSLSSTKLNLPEDNVDTQTSKDYINAVDDLALAEIEQSLLNKEGSNAGKPLNNQSQLDNITRAFTDVNAQATQVKQTNDAYSNYQDSEMLHHNVATDTAQIQKNNVQLHQETISIFRKDFTDAVKDKVMLMINQKLQQFDITLDPPEFGNMQVRVNLQGEQAAVNFVVQNQQAKDALEQNMHKLRDMLAEQGVDVGGANVEQQNQQNSQGEQQSEQQNSTLSSLNNNAENDSDIQLLSANLFNSSATGVDYYA